MNHPKIAKGIIIGSFTGLAAMPGLYYTMVVQPVQRVQMGSVNTVAAQDKVLKDATSTGRILFGLGLFFLLLLITYVILGFRFQQREINDEK